MFQFLSCLENGLETFSFKLMPDSWMDDISNSNQASSFILERVAINDQQNKDSICPDICYKVDNLLLSPISGNRSKESAYIDHLNLADEHMLCLQNNIER
jgi:hypothetical protein